MTYSLFAFDSVSTNLDVRRYLPRGQQLRTPGQQFPECWHKTFAELGEIVVSRSAGSGVSRDQSGVSQLPQISGEFFLADGGNRREQFVVSLRAIEQQRAEEQELPFAADDLNRFFNGAGRYGVGHSAF